MLKSLCSGIAGLQAHQTKMDVTANNIANVNTTAFKASRVTFKDVYYQTLSNASANTDTQGGINAQQVGYGSNVSTIDILNTQGGVESTDRTLDLYLSGDGYFVVQDKTGARNYTRAGNFSFDLQGGLVDSSGNYVAGWQPQNTGDGTAASPISIANVNDYTDIAIGTDGKITGVYAGESEHKINAGEKVGSLNALTIPGYTNLSYANGIITGDSTSTAATGVQLYNNVAVNADGTITGDDMVGGTASNVIGNIKDFTAEPADYSDWAISTDGTINGLYRGHFTNTTEEFGSINGPSLAIAGYTNVVYANGSITGTDATTGVSTTIYNNVKFDTDGTLIGDNAVTSVTDETIGSVNLDNMLKNSSQYTNITIAADGTVSGKYIGAQVPTHITDAIETLGQIAVAKFTNEAGLSQQGGIYFGETTNSGTALITTAGNNGTGKIVSGGLEMSNVDLAKEFTDMITTQRGFQANSRVITVSDTLLEELVNLKR